MGNGGQSAITLIPDADSAGSGSLLDSILSTLSIPDILGLKGSYWTAALYMVLYGKVHKSTAACRGRTRVAVWAGYEISWLNTQMHIHIFASLQPEGS